MECDVPPPLPKNLRNEIAIPEEFVEWERFIPFLTSFTEQVRLPFSPWFTLENTRQNGRRMTSFWGAMAKLGAGVDNELGGSALHQCR